MRYQSLALMLGCVITTTAGCGYHLCGTTIKFPSEIKTLILNSYDSYSLLTRAVRAELRSNNVTLVNDNKGKHLTALLLKILDSSENQVITSVSQNGNTTEYQMTLSVQAQVLIPGKDYCPINVKVYHYLFKKPLMPLAKDAEDNFIRQELRQRAAQQLVHKLLTVCFTEKANDALKEKSKQQ